MHNHEPLDYRCPFCSVVQGIEADGVHTRQADVFYRDGTVTAFVSSHWWPKNKGHVLIVPNRHVENLFDIPDDLLAATHVLSKKVAGALKSVYGCDGVSIRQHNEPAGNQDVWHYHLHVFPRYEGDNLYLNHDAKILSDPKDRQPFAQSLRRWFAG